MDGLMQKLMTVQQYIDETFVEGSAPHKATVYRWIRRGEIDGVRIGDRYYVSAEQTTKPKTSFKFLNETQP